MFHPKYKKKTQRTINNKHISVGLLIVLSGYKQEAKKVFDHNDASFNDLYKSLGGQVVICDLIRELLTKQNGSLWSGPIFTETFKQ